jgi:uncharacterized protein
MTTRRTADPTVTVPTPLGPARVHRRGPQQPVGTLALGHGAGGGIGAADLQAVADAAAAIGWQVLLVEQPWRVAGGRVAPAPPRLDLAWNAVLAALRDGLPGLAPIGPLVVGGRSAGARVACRTGRHNGAIGICALAFPLHPPGRPERSRAAELAAAGLPVLVLQGQRDPFGGPDQVSALGLSDVRVEPLPGDHSLAAGASRAGELVAGWLPVLRPDPPDRHG